MVWIVGCNDSPPPPAAFDPRILQQDERSHASEVPVTHLEPLPTTRQEELVALPRSYSSEENRYSATEPSTQQALDREPVVLMSLQEMIHRAVANNHDVKVAAYEPAIEGTRAIEAAANFDPTYFMNLQYQEKNELNGGNIYNSFSGGPLIITNISDSDIGTFQTGFQNNLPSGGQIQLQYQSTYNWFNPQQTLYSPFFESDLTLSLTQPLLKNFGYDVNHAQLVIDRLNQKVDLLEFRKAVEQNAADIEKAYWQLWQAVRDIEIQEQYVAETEVEYDILFNRQREKMDVSPLQVAQAQTQLELRRSQLIEYKARAHDLSDQLKALMSDPNYPVTGAVVLLPADPPVEDRIEFGLDDQISTAMENRFELGEQQSKIDAAAVTLDVAKNNLLPEVDFIGSVGPQGAAGDLTGAIKKNYDFNHMDFTAGVKIQVPIGNRAAKAIWERSFLQRGQAIEQYQSYVEQIAADVKVSARAVDTAWEVIRAARASRFAAEDALERINTREKNGEPLTPEFVQLKLQIQDALAQSLHNEADAISGYNIALSQLEKSKGTLLRYNNVILVEKPPDSGWGEMP
jgi:outer membrane protein TolC